MVAIARRPAEWPEYAQADFTPKVDEPEQYEANWHSKHATGWLHRQIARTTFGWLLVTIHWTREDANGMFEWRGVAVWHKLDATSSQVYFRTKLIPTIRILWLWLRLAVRREKEDASP